MALHIRHIAMRNHRAEEAAIATGEAQAQAA